MQIITFSIGSAKPMSGKGSNWNDQPWRAMKRLGISRPMPEEGTDVFVVARGVLRFESKMQDRAAQFQGILEFELGRNRPRPRMSQFFFVC